jgi:hypothetical protein
MSESNFPLKVVCPECCAAITAKCTHCPPHVVKWIGEKFVDWFHFARIEKAKEEGYGND